MNGLKTLRAVFCLMFITLVSAQAEVIHGIDADGQGWSTQDIPTPPRNDRTDRPRPVYVTRPSNPQPNPKTEEERIDEQATKLNNQGFDEEEAGDLVAAVADYEEAARLEPEDLVIAANLKNARLELQEQIAQIKRKSEDATNVKTATRSINHLADSITPVDNPNGLDFVGAANTKPRGGPSTLEFMEGRSNLPNPDGATQAVSNKFQKQRAIQDVLTAKAHGKASLKELAAYIPMGEGGFNPALDDALERAKAETDQKFATTTVEMGSVDIIVFPESLNQSDAGQIQPLRVPVGLKKNPRFQRLVYEQDALARQNRELEKKIQTLKADPATAKDSNKLTSMVQIESGQQAIRGMEGYLNNLTKDVIRHPEKIGYVDFGEDPGVQLPSLKIKPLDSVQVPLPK